MKQDTGPDLLTQGLQRLGVDPAAGEPLAKYLAEIERFNPAYHLVKVQDRRELVVKHILDSLAPLAALPRFFSADFTKGARIADAGSGAGLPGIPLAIAFPRARFTLIERMGRRAGFLRNCLAALPLPHAVVEEAEIETAAPRRFDIVVCRALPPPLTRLARLLLPGGLIAAYKGRRAAIEKELSAAAALLSFDHAVIPLEVPFLDEERHLVFIHVTGIS
jgi:16S rRNA (guanine527-N7)-methyltransferase